MRNAINILIMLILSFSSLFGQNKQSYIGKGIDSLNLCGEFDDIKKLVGKKLKIYHIGGIFSTANGINSDFIEWINDDVKLRAGKSNWNDFEPQNGDIGEVIQVGKTKYDEIIYILKIQDYYVPIKCSYLTQENNLSVEELSQKRWDEIYAYGEGNCNFKKFGYNEVWNRAGIFQIDKMPENFACELLNQNIDTIMMVKRIYDNGSSPNEMVYVLWKESQIGFLKTFRNNTEHTPISSETEKFNWNNILDFYENNVKEKNNERPKSVVSHWTNLVIQLYQKDDFYSFGMQLICTKEDENLPNVKFVRFIEEMLR
jgi:NOL1/NOP2/fmu family ribosome biogenesis protein